MLDRLGMLSDGQRVFGVRLMLSRTKEEYDEGNGMILNETCLQKLCVLRLGGRAQCYVLWKLPSYSRLRSTVTCEGWNPLTR